MSNESWINYRRLLDLEGLPENDERVQEAKVEMLDHPLIQGLIGEMKEWPGQVLNSHKSAGQLYHKLVFLADLGITAEDGDFSAISEYMKHHVSEEGLFRLPTNIPVHFGGSGSTQWAWALCDAPTQMYSAIKMDLFEDKISLNKGVTYLNSLIRENGWPCKVSKELGKFRGPGKKDDPCPYVNLIMLKLLTLFEPETYAREIKIGIDCLLDLWENSQAQHPYMFFMGTDFRKLKAPMIWYDIVHITEVLSHYEYARRDPRFQEMITLLRSKADANMAYTPESEWKAWKGWDFGQKKMPSPWLTFIISRILKRSYEEA